MVELLSWSLKIILVKYLSPNNKLRNFENDASGSLLSSPNQFRGQRIQILKIFVIFVKYTCKSMRLPCVAFTQILLFRLWLQLKISEKGCREGRGEEEFHYNKHFRWFSFINEILFYITRIYIGNLICEGNFNFNALNSSTF